MASHVYMYISIGYSYCPPHNSPLPVCFTGRMGYLGAFMCMVLTLVLVRKLWEALVEVVWRPYAITRWFEKQGVRGPPYKLLKGNVDEIRSKREAGRCTIMDVQSHDFLPRVLPHYLNWSSKYGNTFLYWMWTRPRICITDVEIAKQILSNKFGFFAKEKPRPVSLALLGKGLVMVEGSDWACHRRVVSPTFTMDKLKEMASGMAICTLSILDKWQVEVMKSKTDQSTQIEMNKQFQELTAEVISYTAFGQSYLKGKEVFKAQKELQILAASSIWNMQLPGYQYLPTKNNRRRWALERAIRETLTQIIRGRSNNKEGTHGNDLLGLMMDSCGAYQPNNPKSGDLRLDMNEIIDECKTFFFAGHETTSHLLTWTMFLLALHQDWQEKLRVEVLEEIGTSLPNVEGVSKLKLIQMVLLEALRLYGPVVMLIRRSTKEMKLGDLEIPKNTRVTIPIALMHRSKEVWGPDASEFNTFRFENGVSKVAKHPNALFSFSLGPRSCVGQNFAMLEARIVMAMILQKFSFTLSPNYKHAPLDVLTLQPQFGLPIILKSLKT